MSERFTTLQIPRSATAEIEHGVSAPSPVAGISECCYHCGDTCPDHAYAKAGKVFCCRGCLAVFELLTESGLTEFYQLNTDAGVKGKEAEQPSRFLFADEPAVREKLVDYSDARLTRVTFRLPAMHCVACVWLLENLYRLRPGIGECRVHFPKRELAVAFETERIRLSQVMALLASLGYEPELRLSDLDGPRTGSVDRRLWLQLGIAGFAFGNTMLFSIASYVGLDSGSGPGFRRLVGLLSILLALPVISYSARDYWRSAWVSLRRGLLNIDVPIAAGLAAIFLQSSYEVFSGRGEGYFDSLAGLLFFLLCGKLFQRKTFDRLAFDRDYRSFFPLSVTRRAAGAEELVALSQVTVGDQLVVRRGELIPADGELVEGEALIDYSFVTGESEPVERKAGDHLYAGGRQMGGTVTVQTVKAVSQGYLTSLWNQEAFRKNPKAESLNLLTNRYSQRFTKLVIGIAFAAAAYWLWADPTRSLKAFTSVLIVACPCALALAAPFALGMAQRILARHRVFLKNTEALERMAAADTIVFDKTGTLTIGGGTVRFLGNGLTSGESDWIRALMRQSTHPNARRILTAFGDSGASARVRSFQETPGSGMEGMIDGRRLLAGSARWLEIHGVPMPPQDASSDAGQNSSSATSAVHLAVDRVYRGRFEWTSVVRPETGALLTSLAEGYSLALLSGDNASDRPRFQALFGSAAQLHFQQSPLDKLEFVQGRQRSGHTVIMVGDGLNDAGALQQSDVGIAVVEDISAFSPASDVIMSANMVPQLAGVMRFARATVWVVRACFLLSTCYNVVGISIAARGLLSPVVCAILMPLSSATVVLLACGLTTWLGRKLPREDATNPGVSEPVRAGATPFFGSSSVLAAAGGPRSGEALV